MNSIKKYNVSNSNWDIISSNDAKGIGTTNPKLLQNEETIVSVDTAMERLKTDLDTAKSNIAWLAIHGGGGSGGGGGTTTAGKELTTTISVNGQASGSQVVMGKNGLQITFSGLDIKYNKGWKVTVSVNSVDVQLGVVTLANPTIFVTYDKVFAQLQNHFGNLSVIASYEDDVNAIYGSGIWTGSVVDNDVQLSSQNVDATIATLSATSIALDYSVGVYGEYTLNVEVTGKQSFTRSFDLNITTSSIQTQTILLSSIFSGISDDVGTYKIKYTLTNKKYSEITNEIISTLTIVSTEILIASTAFSEDSANPTDVSIDGSIGVIFTAYIQQLSIYKYWIRVGGTEAANGADGELISGIEESGNDGTFGKETQQYVSCYGKSWAVQDQTSILYLYVSSADKSAYKKYYVRFIKSTDSLLEDTNNMKYSRISFFEAAGHNQNDTVFNYNNTSYNSTSTASSTLTLTNINSNSGIKYQSDKMPFLRIGNGSCGYINNFNILGSSYNTFDSIVSAATKGKFTIQVCFKADYHPDDDRTILFCGSVSQNPNYFGQMQNGISIDVHGVYVNTEKILELNDNVKNDVTITCERLSTLVEVTNAGTTTTQSVDQYVVKVYLDGVVSAIRTYSNIIEFGDNVYIGCRKYVSAANDVYYNLCDVNIYSLNIYTECLNEYDIMTDYINNKVRTKYDENGVMDYSIIPVELKKNFCVRTADGVKSLLYGSDSNTGYGVNFMLGANGLDINQLTENASSISIPIMYIDVSNDSAWTFNQFVSQQSESFSNEAMSTSGHSVQYWDPNGSNQSIVELKDVTVALQGTSTLSDSVKNLNITLKNSDVFVPKQTWFPEQTYTLKADVVDSSHANNASIGGFINEVLGGDPDTAYFQYASGAVDNFKGSTYVTNQHNGATLKHTVEGFPVFVIIKFYTDGTNNKVSTTPLGIYSFNLGRNAYRNLGMKKLTSITDEIGETFQVNAFPFYKRNVTYNETADKDIKANWIEIEDTVSLADFQNIVDTLPSDVNTAQGDFWQNDDGILNARYSVKFPANKQVSNYKGFKNFVSNIMQLPIERCYSSDSLGNINSTYISGSYALYTIDNLNNYSKTGQTQTISIDTNDFNGKNLGFDFSNAIKYFIICNFFGLIDNFGKNSTYRSWDDSTYYLDFYDLDSGNGGDNQGLLSITPDVWLKYLTNKGTTADSVDGLKYVAETFNHANAVSNKTVSANTSKLWLSLDTSYSRYLFGSSDKSLYSKYWFDFRTYLQSLLKNTNYKQFYDYFVDKYFIAQTAECGSLIFNYDYKLKYLLQFTADSKLNAKAVSKLHGRKEAHTRSWLKKHTIFLDSLFNWRDEGESLKLANTITSNQNVVTQFNSQGTLVQTFTVMSNCPIISRVSVGSTVKAAYFLQDNVETLVNVANIPSGGPYSCSITNSNNYIKFGNTTTPINKLQLILFSANEAAGIDASGMPALTQLEFAENKNFSNFTLDPFRMGALSEVRKMDFSNTSGNSFILDIEQNHGTPNATTKFTKLTEINISGSKCISNAYISTSIPLMDLQVFNSNIVDFELNNQQYIADINLVGCDKLQDVTIQSCHKYTNVNLVGYSDLQSVKILNCDNIETITIQNCPTLQVVDIESCKNLKTITISGCNSLVGGTATNYVTLTDLNSLTSLDLSNCRSMTNFKMINCNQANVISLNLSGTKIKCFTDSSDTELLDLYAFTNLSSFDIRNNNAVVNIQFSNVKDNPIALSNYLMFNKCSSLKRIYGNLSIKTNMLFANLKEFSIHGSDINTVQFNGKSVVDSNNRVLLPCEVDGKVTGGVPNLDYILTFQTGTGVTNFVINTTNIDSLCMDSNCTLFDVYYLFNAIGTMSVSCNNVFNVNNQPLFYWTSSVDNSPNRYMFFYCRNITSLVSCFYGASTTTDKPGYLRLFSPTVTGSTFNDNGLFSYTKNLTSINNMFLGYTMIYDKNLFRFSSGTLNLTDIGGLVNGHMVNNIGARAYFRYDQSVDKLIANGVVITDIGDLTGFFTNLQKLKGIRYLLPAANFVNYNTITNIPKTVTTIYNSFSGSYGSGKLVLADIFDDTTTIQEIGGSFRVSGTYSDGTTTYKLDLPLDNNFLSGMTNLKKLGYDEIGTYSYGGVSNYLGSNFMGNGINKYINSSKFPFEMFDDCRATLYMCSSLFNKCNAGNMNTTPSLPGTLFSNMPNLVYANGVFNNVNFKYTLSSGGFEKSTKLQKVEYMFAADDGRENYLTGYIPNKLFFNGWNTQAGKTSVLTGFNGTVETSTGTDEQGVSYTQYDITRDDGNTFTVINKENVITCTDNNQQVVQISDICTTSPSFTFNLPYKSVDNMEGCFQSANIQPYTNTDVQSEPNQNYEPFDYLFTNNKIVKGSKNLFQTTKIWVYDGVNKLAQTESENTSELEQYDGEINGIPNTYIPFNNAGEFSGTLNFCSAPDLFRYCNDQCNITKVFNACGHNSQSDRYGNNFSNYTYTGGNGYGLHGRICPYLLLPFKNTSIPKDISYMFNRCRTLSYYTDNKGSSYVIPKDFFKYCPKISSMKYTFSGTSHPYNVDLNVFSPIGNTCNTIDYIFYISLFNGTSDNRCTLSNVFSSFGSLISAKYAFAADIDATSPSPNKKDQYVTFDNVFKPRTYNGINYNNNSKFSCVFAFYKTGYVTHETSKTLVDNTITNNYINKG